MRALLSYVRPHRATLAVAGLLGLLGAAAGLAQPLAAREVIEALAADDPVWRPIAILTALVVGTAFVTAVHFWLLERTGQRVVLHARRGPTGRVLRLRMAELDGLRPATSSPSRRPVLAHEAREAPVVMMALVVARSM